MTGEVSQTAPSVTSGTPELRSSVVPAKRIGRRTWTGKTVVAQALHVTYQQKLFVSGYIAPTYGGIYDGTGAVFGAGGSIGSSNESVVTVVHADERGVENTTELPSGISLREGTIFRMDYLDGRLFAARNISGNQGTRFLLSPANFIGSVGFKKRDLACCFGALLALSAANWAFVALFMARPAWVMWRKVELRRQRAELGQYMASIAS